MFYRIRPFKDQGLWVVTDIGVGLDKDFLLASLDGILDKITQSIPDAPAGFELQFSDREFDGSTHCLEWQGSNVLGSQRYRCRQLDMEGWTSPLLRRYFDTPPPCIFLRALYLRKPTIFSYPLSMREPHEGLIKPQPLPREEAERKFRYVIEDPEQLQKYLDQRFPKV